MNNWCMAANNINKSVVAAADKSTKNKADKKDKPNPNQPSKPKEAKPEKPSTFVADTTPVGEKKDCTKPMLPEYHPK
jgi:hypothetical protein